MGYPTKVQLIKRRKSEQWYINFPSAVAAAMEFERGEVVEWFVEDKKTLVLKRPDAPPGLLEKKTPSSSTSKSSGARQGEPSSKAGRG